MEYEYKCRICQANGKPRWASKSEDELHLHLRDVHTDYYADWDPDTRPWEPGFIALRSEIDVADTQDETVQGEAATGHHSEPGDPSPPQRDL